MKKNVNIRHPQHHSRFGRHDRDSNEDNAAYTHITDLQTHNLPTF
jgi:hypothetical protein